MAGEWETVKLGDVTTWASGGTPSKGNPAFWNGDIPWISASSMKTPLLCDSDLKITPQGLENGSRLADTDSILLLVRGSELHKRIPVGIATRPVAFNQDVKALKVHEAICSEFLFYWLLGNESMLLGKVEHTGIGAGKLDTIVLKNLRVELPPLPEQKAIAAVLGALDDKIELNRRMNATLEAMARALFQSWFVDFDPVRAKLDGRQPPNLAPATAALFPDSFQDSELGPIPRGWEVCPLSEKIELLSGGTPKTSEPSYWDGDIPWYSVKDAPSEADVWVIHTEKQVTMEGIANSAAQILPEGTTIISARGTVGKLALIGTPMAMNQSCYGVRGIKGYGDFFTYFALRQATAELQQRTHGTVFDTITRQTFETLDCIFPPANLTAAFDRTVEPLLAQVRANLHQSRTLATLRDTLLPKLLSGELTLQTP